MKIRSYSPFYTPFDPLPPIRLPLPKVTQCPPGMVMGPNGCAIGVVDPFPPTMPPAFCGGNSGIPCPPDGLSGVRSWDNTHPIPPDLRSGLFGLGDLTPPGHVAAGTRIHWEAQVSCGLTGSPPSWDNFVQSLAPALINASGGFAASIWPGYSNLIVEATVGFERNSQSDIVSDLITSAEASGCSVNSSNPLTIVTGYIGTQRPTTGGGQPGQPGRCDAETGLNWVACQMGLGGASSDIQGAAKLSAIGIAAIAGLVILVIAMK